MKKLLFALVALVLLAVCAVSASAAETPVKMELTAPPEKLIYTSSDAVERTESVWNAAADSVTLTTYQYYPIDFSGLEITFTYADESTKVFSFDDELSLAGQWVTVRNETVQNVKNPWTADNFYDVVLSCGSLTVDYQVLVISQLPEEDNTVVGFQVAEYPAKCIYLNTEAFTATQFGENGEVLQYKAYPFSTDGMQVMLTYADGSILYCTPEMLPALTGVKMQVIDNQSAGNEWKLGINFVKFVFGEFFDGIDVYVDVEGHQIKEYDYNGNDSHIGICRYCEQSFTSDCEGGEATCAEPAVCTICKNGYGETKPHDVTYTYDADGHTQTCKNCDYVDEDIPHTFTAGSYDTENKQALYSCDICTYEVYGQPVGDIDGNGEITTADAREALRAAVGLTQLSEQQTKLADVDGSGSVDTADARLILRIAVGLEKTEAFIPVGVSEPENE